MDKIRRMRRFGPTLLVAALAMAGPAAAQVLAQGLTQGMPQEQTVGPALRPAVPAAAARSSGDLWFDPTQLPSFTGTVERYLVNPRGETDALLFREGPQIVFPPDVAEAVRQAAPPGRPIIVWGIRARGAPVITMLAFAPSAEATPLVVERFYWRLSGRRALEAGDRVRFSGTVKQPYFSPQGEVAGAILEDGIVVLLPQGAGEGFRDLLKPGAKLAAEGVGQDSEAGRAVLADRLGEAAGALRPVAAPAVAR